MAYILGLVIPIVLAVALTWNFGLVGGIAWIVIAAIAVAVHRRIRKHFDPMLIYDAEQRARRR